MEHDRTIAVRLQPGKRLSLLETVQGGSDIHSTGDCQAGNHAGRAHLGETPSTSPPAELSSPGLLSARPCRFPSPRPGPLGEWTPPKPWLIQTVHTRGNGRAGLRGGCRPESVCEESGSWRAGPLCPGHPPGPESGWGIQGGPVVQSQACRGQHCVGARACCGFLRGTCFPHSPRGSRGKKVLSREPPRPPSWSSEAPLA